MLILIKGIEAIVRPLLVTFGNFKLSRRDKNQKAPTVNYKHSAAARVIIKQKLYGATLNKQMHKNSRQLRRLFHSPGARDRIAL